MVRPRTGRSLACRRFRNGRNPSRRPGSGQPPASFRSRSQRLRSRMRRWTARRPRRRPGSGPEPRCCCSTGSSGRSRQSAAALCSLSADWPIELVSATAGLVLIGRLRGPVQVAGRRVRGRDVRLRDRAVVAGAQDADRDVLVRCAFLIRQRGCIRLLSVVSGLADRLRASGRALARIRGDPGRGASASARACARRLALAGGLRRPVHVRRSRVRRGLVRLRSRTVVARAQDPDGSVRVRRILLDGCGECRRVLIVARRLPDRLGAASAAAGSGLVLTGGLLRAVGIACGRIGRCIVRLRDGSVVAVAEHANGSCSRSTRPSGPLRRARARFARSSPTGRSPGGLRLRPAPDWPTASCRSCCPPCRSRRPGSIGHYLVCLALSR